MCEHCNFAKMPYVKVRTPLHSIVAREPLEVIAVDVTVLEPASSGIENVLVMKYAYSKFTIAVPTWNQTVQTVKLWYGSGSSVMEFRVGYTRTRDVGLKPRFSPSCTRFTRSRNPEQPRTIRWETDNARDMTEHACIAMRVDTHSEIQVARTFARINICLQCNTSCRVCV